MRARARRGAAFALLVAGATLLGATTAPPTSAARNDYAMAAFTAPLELGLRAFYARDFKAAQSEFERSLRSVPDNTFAMSFYNAAAAQQPGELDIVGNVEEDAAAGAPKNYVNHVRLGFTYLFESLTGRDRSQDAREEFTAAVALDADAPAAHVGLGILRFNERSTNRSKTEMLAALRTDPSNVLAREYLGQLYQSDLRDPQRGLQYVIDVPNLVPGYADIQFHIGSLLSDLGQYAAALVYLRRGIELDAGHVGEAGQHGYTAIADIELQQHDPKAAAAVLQSALDADVDTIIARTLLAKIKRGDYDGKGATAAPSALPSGS